MRYTWELLAEFCEAALKNSEELIAEASLLHSHGHEARGYFLAVASIEETGKALLAFESQSRNLADSAVSSRLKLTLSDHVSKIVAAFAPLLMASGEDLRASLPVALKLMSDLKRGREPSMYTDINRDFTEVRLPRTMARAAATSDCIRLATVCLAHCRNHTMRRSPATTTKEQDHFFAIGAKNAKKIFNMEDFWLFHVSECEAGRMDIPSCAARYEKDYIRAGKLFKPRG